MNSSAKHKESAPNSELRTAHSITTNDHGIQSNDELTLMQGDNSYSGNTDDEVTVLNNDSNIFVEPEFIPGDQISKDSEANISRHLELNSAMSKSFIGLEPEDLDSLSVVGYFPNLVPFERNIPGIKTDSEKSTGSLPTSGKTLTTDKYFTSNPCSRGEIRHAGGRCVMPKVKHNIFVYEIPRQPQRLRNIPSIPEPEVNHNILFLKLSKERSVPEPIIVPPNRQRNTVYVLRKVDRFSQRIIRTKERSTPQIYVVSFGKDKNPSLPDGTDLEVSLQSAIPTKLKVIGNESGSSAPMVSQPIRQRKKGMT